MYFSDLHVQLLSRGILNPGEQLLSQTVTSYRPWWALGFIQRQHLVMATDQRLVLVDHRLQFFPVSQTLHGVESIPWNQVNELKVTGIFQKKLKVKGAGDRGPVSHKLKITNTLFGLLAPMKNNMQGARGIAQHYQQQKLGGAPQLAAPQSYGAPQLAAPVSQHYGAPPASYGQPQQPAYGQPPMPMINAPGYQSSPPPAPHGYPQQMQSPFEPPRQF